MDLKKLLLPSLLVCSVLALIHRLFAKRYAKPALLSPVSKGSPFEAIDAYLEEKLHRLNIPGAALAIVEGDRIVHLRGFGRARPGGEPPTPQTPFFIGSLTKSFTALAVMQLVEAGKIELDAPVRRYLPWFRVADPQASAQVTVRHLLVQTSGFSQTAGWLPLADFDGRPDSTEQQARLLSTYQLERPVGSAFEYSNVNYNLLGLVIEAASGESYAAYIQNHIFDPLGMCHSYTSKAAAKRDRLAVGHQSWFGAPLAVPDLPVPEGALPSGELISSAEDVAHYLIAHLNGGWYNGAQILSPEGITELHRPAAELKVMGSGKSHYGMGWFIDETGQGTVISHKGTVPDFFAYMALLPGKNRGMVLLVNANHLLTDFALWSAGADAATLLAGGEPKAAPLGAVPWVSRGFLLIPILQIAGVAATLRQIHRWRHDPQCRPDRGRLWGQHILLPLIPNLSLAAVPVYLLASSLLRFMLLFLPDITSIGILSGGFAGIWAILRTGLILRAMNKPSSPQAFAGRAAAGL